MGCFFANLWLSFCCRHQKWKHHKGPTDLNYVTDARERRKTRSERKKTLCVKSHELVQKCGGEIFFQYRDENDRIWTYCSNDRLWENYQKEGIRPQVSKRLDDSGKDVLQTPSTSRPTLFPTPTKTSPGDCNFTISKAPSESNQDRPESVTILDIIGPVTTGTDTRPVIDLQILPVDPLQAHQYVEQPTLRVNEDRPIPLAEQDVQLAPPSDIELCQPIVVTTPEQPLEDKVTTPEQPRQVIVNMPDQPQQVIVTTQDQPQQVIVTTQDQPQPVMVTTTDQPQQVMVTTTDQPQQVMVTTTDQPQQVMVTTTDQPQEVMVTTQDQPQEVLATTQDQPQEVLVTTQDQPQEVVVTTQDQPQQVMVTTTDQPQQVMVTTPDQPQQVMVTTQDEPQQETVIKPDQPKPRTQGKTAIEKRKSALLEKLSRIRSKKMKTTGSSQHAQSNTDKDDTKCAVCSGIYVAALDNRKHGRWVGCEVVDKCGTWVHRKCISFSERDVDKKKFYCDKCKKK